MIGCQSLVEKPAYMNALSVKLSSFLSLLLPNFQITTYIHHK